MKTLKLLLLSCMVSMLGFSQDTDTSFQKQIDSIEKSFTYQRGSITLKDGIGTLTVPAGFKYLDAKQAERVLVDLWGNPSSENISLGLLLPENHGVMSDSGYVFNIQYDEIGYVKDGDADEIDYKELLETMQQEATDENELRKKEGYETIEVVGWASTPYYDKNNKILHWAKEIKFGENEDHTLNYNIRVLGRKGVLVLNAISSMDNLNYVKADIPKVLNVVQFTAGNQYKDFDSSVDNVAAWTIGGLVAGKVLAKAGLFAVILKFGKVIAIGAVGLFGFIWNRFKKKKENAIEEEASSENQNALTSETNATAEVAAETNSTTGVVSETNSTAQVAEEGKA